VTDLAYLVETSALSALLQDNHSHHAIAEAVFSALPDGSAQFASIVTVAEMEFGLKQVIANGAHARQIAAVTARIAIVRNYAPLPLTHHTAINYAELKSKIAQHIQPKANSQGLNRWIELWQDGNVGSQLGIDENDLWIAAQAKERDFTVIAGDRDFEIFSKVDPDVRVIYTCPPRA
jgi:tRNA(fMet)-specific endonuclease VapC